MKEIIKMVEKFMVSRAVKAYEEMKRIRRFRTKDGGIFAVTSVSLSHDKKTLNLTLVPILETEEDYRKNG